MTDTTAVRDTLESLRDELLARRGRIADHARAGVPADSAEQVTARENDEVMASLAVQIDRELGQINAALGRLERGEYERCERCGGSIEAARLTALPYTASCSRCAD